MDINHAKKQYFHAKKQAGDWANPETARTVQYRVDRFVDWVEKPLDQIDRQTITEYLEVLLSIESHLRKPMSPVTINKNISDIGRFLKHCSLMSWREGDPTAGVKLSTKLHAMRNRSIDKRLPIPPTKVRRVIKYHTLCEVMAWSGLRNTEAHQLRVKDLVRLENVWCLDLTPLEPGLQRKSLAAMRVVPVHPSLLKTLLDCTYGRGQNDKLIDSKIEPKSLNRKLNNKIHRYIDPNCSLYSLRHSFVDGLKHQIRRDYLKELVGHSSPDLIDTTYGSKTPPGILLDQIKKLTYPL